MKSHHQRMVLFPHDLKFNISGVLGDTYPNDGISGQPVRLTQEQIFHRLTGRRPVGPIQARVTGDDLRTISLTVQDAQGSMTFEVPVNLQGERNQVFLEGKGMYIFRKYESGQLRTSFVSDNYGEIAPGTLTTKRSEILPLIVEVNIPNANRLIEGPIRINLITSEHGQVPLFKSALIYYDL